MNCGWPKEAWQYVTIHGIDKYNTMFQSAKKVLHQNKPHSDHNAHNFIMIAIFQAGFLTFKLFFLLIFLL